MKVDVNEVGLVRGYVIYSQWRYGVISLDLAKDDNCKEVGIAYTLWHRHDENPEIVEKELEMIRKVYAQMHGVDCMALGFEYKPYER